ncbi:MAG: zinc ribbon domain-containing protein [Dehalococcoidales bacterium]|nr:zinc ribbon domain-containing protein [Dehalococcoidales bacterium]
MPIYEYVCSSCNAKFELLRSMNKADEEVECPTCNHHAERVLSRFACFSTDSSGMTSAVSGGGSSCAGCSSGNCSTCAS